MDKRCAKCYFSRQCPRPEGIGDKCEYYIFIGPEVDDEELYDKMIEDGRREFYGQFRVYISEYQDLDKCDGWDGETV